MRRRDLLPAALALATPLRLAAQPAEAAAWPTRGVRWMVGYAAGGTSDVLARLLGRILTERTNQPVLVENRPGGGAIVATEAVVRAPADGYTLLHVDNGIMVYNKALYSRLPFDPDVDLVPLQQLGRFPFFVLVRRDSPLRSFAEMRAAAGRAQLSYATPAVASPHHLVMELLKARAGIDVLHVPFRGSPAAVQEMLSGRVDCMMCDSGNALPLLTGGEARALLTVTAERAASWPDVPTARELGFDAVAPGWQGLCVARDTPPSIVAAIEQRLQEVSASPEAVARLAALGAERPPGGAAAFANTIRQENATWRPLIQQLGLRHDG